MAYILLNLKEVEYEEKVANLGFSFNRIAWRSRDLVWNKIWRIF